MALTYYAPSRAGSIVLPGASPSLSYSSYSGLSSRRHRYPDYDDYHYDSLLPEYGMAGGYPPMYAPPWSSMQMMPSSPFSMLGANPYTMGYQSSIYPGANPYAMYGGYGTGMQPTVIITRGSGRRRRRRHHY